MSDGDLKNSRTDYLVSVAKGIAGMLPGAGSIVAELVGSIIPNQRIDRIASFLNILEEKLSTLDKRLVEERLSLPSSVSLIEDGFFAAYRAHSDERRTHIASVIKNGIGSETLRVGEATRVLSVLDQMNDMEVILLQAYALHWFQAEPFIAKHREVLFEQAPVLSDDREKRESYAVRQSYHGHLEQLGLVAPKLDVESDVWGREEVSKSRGTITEFGKAVITFIDGAILD